MDNLGASAKLRFVYNNQLCFVMTLNKKPSSSIKLSHIILAIPRVGRKLKRLPSKFRNHHSLELRSTSSSERISPQSESPISSLSGSITQRPLPALPVEVWEQAIEWLVAGYTRAESPLSDGLKLRNELSVCALVCRAWRLCAQFHLFAHLRISANGLSQYGKLIIKSPILCSYAKDIFFYNRYMEESKTKITHKTLATASHAVRITQKLSNVTYLLVQRINLADEHPHLSRHIAALRNINTLEFYSRTPTRISHLARILVGLKSLSTLYLVVPIKVDANLLPPPAPHYATKSSLTRLFLVIQPGGHLLLDWIVKARSFTTSLQILSVILQNQIAQSEIGLIMRGVQSLLDTCAGSLKEWNFSANIQVDDFSSVPKGNLIFGLHLCPLIIVSVSLGSCGSLSKLSLKVSKAWFRRGLEQLKSVTSEHVTQVTVFYWLRKKEKPSNKFWVVLDEVLGREMFKSPLSITIRCSHRDSNFQWHRSVHFDHSQLPSLLPKVYKKGIHIL